MPDTLAPQGTDNPAYNASAPAGGAGSLDPTATPALITTSSASQINHSNNVTSLNNANASIAPTPHFDSNGNVYNQPDGKGGFYSGPVASAPGNVYNVPDGKGGFYSGPAAGAPKPDTTTPVAAPATPGAAAPAGGGTAAADTPSGTQSAIDPATGEADPTAGLPTGLASMYKSQIASQNQAITDAQNAVTAAAATMSNDPAAQAAAAYIQQQYGVLIQAMQEKNKQVLGGYTMNAARSGGLQYANDMTETFMSNEMDRASARIADLTGKMQAAVLKSNAAYAANDIKAFDAAQTAVDNIRKEQSTTLGQLTTATNNQVKDVQAQVKQVSTDAKNTLTADIATSKASAPGIVTALKAAGITDLNDPQVAPYVTAYAQAHGISDPGTLMGELSTAFAADVKATDTMKNADAKTNYAVNKPYPTKSGGANTKVDGGYTYTPQDKASITSFFQTGGTGPDGQKYNGRGADGYVDPGAYTAFYNAWLNQKGTTAGFLKEFPLKTTVNPIAIPKLPAALQPKKTSTKGS
jgi:hypothetical protein